MGLGKLILAAVLALVVMLGLSHAWHGWMMADFYHSHSPLLRETPIQRFIGLGYFILAGLMTVIYPKGYEGGPPVLEGLRFGVMIGILVTLPHGLILYGVEGAHTGTLVVADAAWHVVEQGAGGIAIALVHGPGPSIGEDADE